MSPIPGWLGGAQHIALNMSNVDLATQLHYSLFKGSGGYVLKPSEMLIGKLKEPNPTILECSSTGGSAAAPSGSDATVDIQPDDFWPPPLGALHRVTMTVVALHNLPKVCPVICLAEPSVARAS
jgi:hypothetical protein|eukprot:4938448-Prymnesium_polylepis.4